MLRSRGCALEKRIRFCTQQISDVMLLLNFGFLFFTSVSDASCDENMHTTRCTRYTNYLIQLTIPGTDNLKGFHLRKDAACPLETSVG